MTINEQLIKAILIPEEAYERVDKASEVVDAICLKLLDFISNEKSRYAVMYGDQDKRFAELNEEGVIEYTMEELLTIFKETL